MGGSLITGTGTGMGASLDDGGGGIGVGVGVAAAGPAGTDRLNLLDDTSTSRAGAGRRKVHAVGTWGTVGGPTVGSTKGGRDGSDMVGIGQSNDDWMEIKIQAQMKQ